MRVKHAAAIVDKNGNILVKAHNEKTVNGSIHAECSAILKWNNIKYRKRRESAVAIVVMRTNKNHHISYSKPCVACQRFIDKFDLAVYHT